MCRCSPCPSSSSPLKTAAPSLPLKTDLQPPQLRPPSKAGTITEWPWVSCSLWSRGGVRLTENKYQFLKRNKVDNAPITILFPGSLGTSAHCLSSTLHSQGISDLSYTSNHPGEGVPLRGNHLIGWVHRISFYRESGEHWGWEYPSLLLYSTKTKNLNRLYTDPIWASLLQFQILAQISASIPKVTVRNRKN